MARGEFPSAGPKGFGDGVYPAFALDGFEKNGADSIVKLGFQVGDIIKADKFNAGNQRFEGQAIFFRGGDTHRAESAAMERIVHGKNAVFACGTGGFFRSTGTEPGELQGAIDRFRAAVGKENAVPSRAFGELARQGPLMGMVIKVREMDGTRCFTTNNFYDTRMGMAEGVDGNATEKIEIFFSTGVIHVAATTTG